MPKYTKKDFAPQIDESKAPTCEKEGCEGNGLYKAPKSKEQLGEYFWLCLEHIREYNAAWDYFDGMNADQIEDFMKDAVTGHRPTWDRHERKLTTDDLHSALNDFMQVPRKERKKPLPSLPAAVRKALAVINLEYPYSQKALKTEYRKLVKLHHPDRHKGDKKAEDHFKKISQAYEALLKHAQKNDL